MKAMSRTSALLGATLALSLIAGCSQAPSGGAVDDSPEGAAFQYRQGLMRAIAWKTGQIRGMAQGEIPVDEAVFRKYAADLAVLAGMTTEGFIPDSIVAGSASLPEIWSNWSDFEQKARDFQNAAQQVADAAQSGGVQAASGLVQAVGQSCGACHRPYRRRAEGG